MTLLVADPGPSLLVQDLGRPGYAHLGVPRSGALDPAALSLANRLVGNPDHAAGLESLLGGVELVAEASLRFAVTGARLPVSVDDRKVPWGTAVSVRAGQRVILGSPETGLRSWVALSGGVTVPSVLGSCSTDTLTGLGPAPLRPGDRLRLGGRPGDPVDAAALDRVVADPSLGVHVGPRADWFTDDAWSALIGTEYVVARDSDRVALRLEGPPLPRRITAELPSEGLVAGAVQVPATGKPLVFLADHPTTGGYPVVAVVTVADLARCAQLRPGDTVRFSSRIRSPRGRRDRGASRRRPTTVPPGSPPSAV